MVNRRHGMTKSNAVAPAKKTPKPKARKPGRPSGVNGAEQREKLLDTALMLFARQGIVDTPLAAIAREAGVTPAMLHYYFRTRDQLLDVLIEERLQAPRVAIGEVFDRDSDDPVAVFAEVARRIIDIATEYPWFPALWMREIISDSGLLKQRMQKRFGNAHQHTALQCITRWQSEGRINPALEPSLVFVSIFGLTILPLTVAKSWRNDPLRSSLMPADIARHAAALLSSGVGPHR